MAAGSGVTATIPSCSEPDGGPAAALLFDSYVASADPVTAGSTGTRFFFTNTLGTIYTHTAAITVGAAPGTDPPTLGQPLQ